MKKTIQELLNFSIINIDKPAGTTSFGVDLQIKRALGLSKTSHFGTLDPQVTGVLPIALGRACRLSDYFMHRNKKYVGIIRVHHNIEKEKLEQELEKFIGKIMQLPPVKSRVKREIREREVFSFKILEQDGRDFLFETEVQAGTYIRKLCLHSNTEIPTIKGLKKIKDFCLNPSEIYSFNNGKIELKKPSETQKILSLNKMIRLKMSSGVEIIATPDHKMLVSRDRGYEMIEIEKLKVGDYITKAKSLPVLTRDYCIADLLDDEYLIEDKDIKEKCGKAMINKFGSIRSMNRRLKLDRKVFLTNSKYAISIKHLKSAGIYENIKEVLNTFKTPKGNVIKIDGLTKEHFYLLGLIASDGNNTKEKKTRRFTRLKFHNINEDLIDTFSNSYKRLFPSIKISKKWVQNKIFQIDTSNSLFASIAANLGIVSPNRYSDVLPILYCKDEFIKAFLKGYFDGDGNAYIKKKKNSTTTHSKISFFSVNYNNAKRIHQMLLKLKINSKILKNKQGIYMIDINNIPSKKKFIEEIGANHPRKKIILEEINKLNYGGLIGDENYVGFHYKEFIKKNKAKLWKRGGNLQRVLSSPTPLTRGFYRKCSELIDLPKLDEFIIEKIDQIEIMDNTEDYVFDMTIPETHNFLIETGFVSSNCSDLGDKIGGAHMLELRRVKAGIFSEENIVNLYDFEKAVEEFKQGSEEELRKILIPADEAIKKILPVVQVKQELIKQLLTGKPLHKEESKLGKEEKFAVFSQDKFIGVYKKVDDKDIIARAEFVFN